jgi:secreted trypsin-like serine protease
MKKIVKLGCYLGLVGAALTSCGVSSSDQTSDLSIVGGERVAETDPVTLSTVALVSPSGSQFCTGSLIKADLVLTAAHCLADYTDSQLFVAFGNVALPGYFKREKLRAAVSYTVHSGYSSRQTELDVPTAAPNDIALVKLSQAAPVAYKPIAMLAAKDSIHDGEALLLAGYGLTKWYANGGGVLYKVQSKIGKQAPAVKEFDFAAIPGKSACMGDSGGPAFVVRNQRLVLIGVTSRGSAYCDSTGTYTDVRHFRSWIDQQAVQQATSG